MAKTELLTTTMTKMRAEELWHRAMQLTEDYAVSMRDILTEYIETKGWVALGYKSKTAFVKAFAVAVNKSQSTVWKMLSDGKSKGKNSEKGSENVENTPISEYLDEIGRDLPEPLVDIFSRSDKEIKEVQQYLNSALKCVSDHENKPDPLWQTMPFQTITTAINDAKRALKLSKPYAVCPYCGGDGENCDACKGRGWLNEMQWRVVPEEIKQCA